MRLICCGLMPPTHQQRTQAHQVSPEERVQQAPVHQLMSRRTQPLHQSPTPTSNGARSTLPLPLGPQAPALQEARAAQAAQELGPLQQLLIMANAEAPDTLAPPLASQAQLAQF